MANAEEALSRSLINKDIKSGVKGVDELLGFVVELVLETYPHTHIEVCKDFDKTKKAQWGDLSRVMHDVRDRERTLMANEVYVYFNKVDITDACVEMLGLYLKNDFRGLGYHLGKTMDE